MADALVLVGFGSSASFDLIAGTGQIAIAAVPTSQGGLIELDAIIVAAFQMNGTFKNPSFVTGYVCKSQGPPPNNGAIPDMPRGLGSTVIGFPDSGTVATKGVKMLAQFAVNVQTQPGVVPFPSGTCVARDNETLYVVITGMVDGSVSPAVMTIDCTGVLTLLGRDRSQNEINLKAR